MISVVVTTFERARHLELCLAALGRQRPGVPFEVIVADDGSGDKTPRVVEEFRKRVQLEVRFVQQEHHGFRLARLRNLAVKVARGDYLVFLDGDCVPGDDFLAGHLSVRQAGAFAVGARYHLTEAESLRLSAQEIRDSGVARFIPGRERRRLKWRSRMNDFYRFTGLKDRPKLVGANFGVWRGDYEEINGFDERFIGWGYEDEDFARRLAARGRRKLSAVKQAALVHLWHPPDPSFRGRARQSSNADYFHRGYYLQCCRHGCRHRALSDLKLRCRDLPHVQRRFPAYHPGQPGEVDLVVSEREFDASFEVRGGIVACGEAPLRDVGFVIEVATADVNSLEAAEEIFARLDEIL